MTSQKNALRLHKAGHDPRAAALVALSHTLYDGADSQAALDAVLSSATLVPTDKGLCTELTYGTLRWFLRLEAFAGSFLTRPDKLPAEMRLTLFTALYEMAFLRTPHHGPVNWAVNHISNRFGKGLGRVANGVLRSMQRALKDFNNEAPDLQLRRAMPEWIMELWEQSYGKEAALALLKASQTAPPSGLRLNRALPGWAAAREELLGESGGSVLAVGPAGLAFQGPLHWRAKELIRQGKASRQGAASYEILQALSPESWPRPIWDCCAGRGGKTLTLLEQGIDVALASDPAARRLEGLSAEYARLGLKAPPCPPVLPVAADAVPDFAGLGAGTGLAPLPDAFGTILVDAPCSGFGTLARRPEIRLRRTSADIAALVATQKAILDAVWPRLKPGGRLVYLTCTLNPAENEGRIASFTREHPDSSLMAEFHTPFDSPLREFFYGAMLKKN